MYLYDQNRESSSIGISARVTPVMYKCKKICDIIKRMFCDVYMLFLIFILFAMMRMDRSSVICLSLSITHSFYHISQVFL